MKHLEEHEEEAHEKSIQSEVTLQRIQEALEQAKLSGHRMTLLIEGMEQEGLKATWLLMRWLHLNRYDLKPITFNRHPSASQPKTALVDFQSVNRATLHALLGRESGLIIFNMYRGLNPNLLTAAAGTLRGGGLLILICPPFSKWNTFEDPEYNHFTDTDKEHSNLRPQFLQRFGQMLTTQCHSALLFINIAATTLSDSVMRAIEPLSQPPNHPIKTQKRVINLHEQDQQVKALIEAKETFSVLIADRGRGKTIALARYIEAMLKHDRTLNIGVTAPQKAMIKPIFDYLVAHQDTPETLDPTRLTYLAAAKLSTPDALSAYDTLIVDEAAALPYDYLKTWINTKKRILFATTIDGYEGTGNNFQIRFLAALEQKCQQHRHSDTESKPHAPALTSLSPLTWSLYRLHTPIRWAPEDPLENLLNRAFMLKPRILEHQALKNSSPTHPLYLGPEAFHNHEALLESIHSLLMLAHYRTTPSDFRQLLDAPNNHLFYIHDINATHQGRPSVIAALWAVKEGELDDDLIDAIVQQKRRLKGHLLPQSLALYCGQPNQAKKRFLRVVRIAVHPEAQNKRLGTQLIQALITYAQEHHYHAIGTSFGETEALLNFWKKNRFEVIRRGHKRSPVTGTHAVTLMRT